MKNNMTKAIFCAILGNVIWGFSFLLIDIGLSVISEPYVLLGHRFTFSTLVMLALMVFGKKKLSFKGKNWKPVILLLLMQLCYYLFETYGIIYTNTTISGLVLAVVPVMTILSGALFLKEYPTKRQLLFCILPVLGVIMITLSGKELGVVTPIGILFLLLTLLSSTTYKTANRMAAKEFSPFERTFMVIAISAVAFSVVGLQASSWNLAAYVAPLMHPKYLFSVLSLGLLCSIGANMMVNYATNFMSVFKVSSFGAVSTLCTAIAGIVFLKEPISVSLALGGVLILVGIRQITKPK